MKIFFKISSGAILCLNVLLLFFLIFQDSISIPIWLQTVGRMHPMMLHLPIGALILTAVIYFFKNEFKEGSFEKVLTLLLMITALTSAFTAIMGFVLSKEGGYDESILQNHLITGSGFSLFAWLLLHIPLQSKKLFQGILSVSVLLLVVAGHLGSTLTHGENFLMAPLLGSTDEIIPLTDSTSLYQAAIEPIFRSKCFSCHNAQKLKGDLLMTSVDAIMKGGKNGVIWVAGNPDSSTLIQRINLELEHDDHMPPSGKPPLNESEKDLLYHWILAGADYKTAWTKFKNTDSLMVLAKPFIHKATEVKLPAYTFSYASSSTVESLNTPYRNVTQVSGDSPGLAAEFFVSQYFETERLKELLSVKEQLVSLTLAGMPVTDEDGKLISQFNNLEKLNLNKTTVSGKILTSIKELKKLKIISLVGTSVDAAALEVIAKLPELKEIFIWNTKVEKSQLITLRQKFAGIQWNEGYPPTEILRLTSPILLNDSFLIKKDQYIKLKHNLPGTIIRYTLDGTTPDSINGKVYSEPISIKGFTTLKAVACRKEWWTSFVSEYTFFKSGAHPTTAELLTQADKSYKGEGVRTLIDNKKGTASDFREVGWIAFKEQPFDALFYFENSDPIKSVTFSYCKNYYSYIVQPVSIELWAGTEKNNLKMIQKIIPTEPKKEDTSTKVDAIVFQAPVQSFKYYKIIAKPNSKLPEFISKKREKGWLFVDEVIFN
jgi:uncharacterized membrane protein